MTAYGKATVARTPTNSRGCFTCGIRSNWTTTASELPGIRRVCIGDYESNILALLVMARKMNHAADLSGALPVRSGAARPPRQPA